MVYYHLQWPEASARDTQVASILIDEVLARRRNYPAFNQADRSETTYRQAIDMSTDESVQWDIVRARASESEVIETTLDILRPGTPNRFSSIVVSL